MQLPFEPIAVPAVRLRTHSFSRRRHIDLERVASSMCQR
jgi:hypothetical protein